MPTNNWNHLLIKLDTMEHKVTNNKYFPLHQWTKAMRTQKPLPSDTYNSYIKYLTITYF